MIWPIAITSIASASVFLNLMILGGQLVLQLRPNGAVRRAHVATASGRPPAAPVGACQGISHFIRFFVARLSFVLPLKDVASKAMVTDFSLHLDTAYSGDFFLRNQWLGTDLFFSPPTLFYSGCIPPH